jgi:hypothetical protein
MEISITRMAVATEKEAEQQSGDNRTMGRKHIVFYALYRAEGYISAHLAAQTGFSEADLFLLGDALINMFDHNHSAARGKMNARKLIVFKHDSALGNAPAHKLFDLVKVNRMTDVLTPARAFSDYQAHVLKDNTPVDVCAVLTGSVDAGAYWRKLKQRLNEEGSEVVAFCHELKLTASDGKLRETDCANTEGVFHLIQSIPSGGADRRMEKSGGPTGKRIRHPDRRDCEGQGQLV